MDLIGGVIIWIITSIGFFLITMLSAGLFGSILVKIFKSIYYPFSKGFKYEGSLHRVSKFNRGEAHSNDPYIKTDLDGFVIDERLKIRKDEFMRGGPTSSNFSNDFWY